MAVGNLYFHAGSTVRGMDQPTEYSAKQTPACTGPPACDTHRSSPARAEVLEQATSGATGPSHAGRSAQRVPKALAHGCNCCEGALHPSSRLRHTPAFGPLFRACGPVMKQRRKHVAASGEIWSIVAVTAMPALSSI